MVLLLGGYKISVDDVIRFANHYDIKYHTASSLRCLVANAINKWAKEKRFKLPKLWVVNVNGTTWIVLATKATRDYQSVKAFQFEETEKDAKLLERVLQECPAGWDRNQFEWVTVERSG